jgi:hypothetical protein
VPWTIVQGTGPSFMLRGVGSDPWVVEVFVANAGPDVRDLGSFGKSRSMTNAYRSWGSRTGKSSLPECLHGVPDRVEIHVKARRRESLRVRVRGQTGIQVSMVR